MFKHKKPGLFPNSNRIEDIPDPVKEMLLKMKQAIDGLENNQSYFMDAIKKECAHMAAENDVFKNAVLSSMATHENKIDNEIESFKRVADESIVTLSKTANEEMTSDFMNKLAAYQGENPLFKLNYTEGVNKVNPEKIGVGRYTIVNNGVNAPAYVADNGRVLTDFIAINDALYISVGAANANGIFSNSANAVCVFDSAMNPIGSIATVNSAINIAQTFPYDDVAFVRASWNGNDWKSKYFVSFNDSGDNMPYSEYEKPSIYGIATDAERKIAELHNITPVERVICWGDSLTAGTGAATAERYPAVLQSLIAENNDLDVINMGVGGENSFQIAARYGAIDLIVKPFTVPAGGSSIIEIEPWYGKTIKLLTTAGNNITTPGRIDACMNDCRIGNVRGEVVRNDNGDYVFTPAMNADSITVNTPSVLKTSGTLNYTNETDLPIIWAGTNNTDNVDEIVYSIRAMTDKVKSGKFLVVGLTWKTKHPKIDEINMRLALEYGKQFVDVRSYLMNYALQFAGIAPTAQDISDVANGEIPQSLRVDEVHMNATAQATIANLIYWRGQLLNYWN